ncbi:hypothetical protein L3Q65_00415 (plasmid) [Amycolatopsis sp. FU40]|uniref:hypothetical protein n=1 Tax=Amycolatopsis sp. FU40 TaxID=2914159 RepID=UPI001F42F8F2|nr:hypothetical protein [Amycolatopsis sp. FU40]UKD50943.1 hypothetical protein L3Q65_00415 [Amycolatopsis sp. FU40]
MGEGSWNRENPEGGRRPRHPLADYMAPDEPYPPVESPEWAPRMESAKAAGQLLLLHVLASVMDAEHGLDVPVHLTSEQGADESDEDYARRQETAARVARAQVSGADWSPQVTEELLRIRPSDAPAAVGGIVQVFQGWARDAGYAADLADLRDVAEAVLDAFMPPERRDLARPGMDLLTGRNALGRPGDIDRDAPRLIAGADAEPFEYLHLAVAFAAALFQDRACVPDPQAAVRALAEDTLARYDPDYRPTVSPEPGRGLKPEHRPPPPAPPQEPSGRAEREVTGRVVWRLFGNLTVGARTVACPECGRTQPLEMTEDGGLRCEQGHAWRDREFGVRQVRAFTAQHNAGVFVDRGDQLVRQPSGVPFEAAADLTYRAELDEWLGWPGGDAPDGLADDVDAGWREITLYPVPGAQEWCDWLVWRGIAVPVAPPDAPQPGVRALLPATAANRLWQLAYAHLRSRFGTMDWPNQSDLLIGPTLPSAAERARVAARMAAPPDRP